MSKTKNNKNLFNFKGQKKLLLTIDWLTLNLEDVFQYLDLDENGFYQLDSFILELEQHKQTKHFKKVFNVYYEGAKVFNLACSANSKHILYGRCHLQVLNHLFYSGEAEQLLQDFISSFQIGQPKISRLDLAVDGLNIHPFLNKFLYEKNSVRSVGRVRDTDNIFPVSFNRDNIRHQKFDNFYVGQIGKKSENSSRSSKFIRYYNKTKEIREKGGEKAYILDYWQKSGFDMRKNVYRFEIQLASAFISTVRGFDFSQLFNQTSLQMLLRLSCRQFFEFYYKDSKNVSRCTRIEFFKDFTTATYVRIKRKIVDKIRTIKVSISRLVKDCMTGIFSSNNAINQSETVIKTIGVLLHDYDLRGWFMDKFPFLLQEQQIEAKRMNMEIDPVLQEYWVYDNAINQAA
jgi:hypothetical protein